MASAKNSKTKANSRKKAYTKKPEPRQRPARVENYAGRVISALFFILTGIIVGIGYFVHEGAAVVYISDFLKGIFGYGYWLCAVCLVWAGLILFHKTRNSSARVIAVLLIPLFFSAIICVFSFTPPQGKIDLSGEANFMFKDGQNLKGGGVLPGLLCLALVKMLSKIGAGAIIVIFLIICVSLAVSEPDDWFAQKQFSQNGSKEKPVKQKSKASVFADSLISVKGDYDLDFDYSDNRRSSQQTDDYIDNYPKQRKEKTIKSSDNAPQFVSDIPLNPVTSGRKKKTNVLDNSSNNNDSIFNDSYTQLNHNTKKTKPRQSSQNGNYVNPTDGIQPLSEKQAAQIAGVDIRPPEYKPQPVHESSNNHLTQSNQVKSRVAAATKEDTIQKKITKADVDKETKAYAKAVLSGAENGETDYHFPELGLLNSAKSAESDSKDEILSNKIRLENALHSFGINSYVINITHGPSVTRYDIELEQGVKLTKVTNLSNDLALSLGVTNVRIAPIPGEISTVGIEVPNKIINTVCLSEIIGSDNFINAKSKLSFAIGKDIGGNAIVGNISKLPHMLIAGTTGSGKSVCMNCLILSLLYKARPDEVKFIMIDPKMVELGIYNSIPHLYTPVVTEPKKAAGALQWSVVEMLKRYRLFSDAGVRDIDTYNELCSKNLEPTLPKVVIVIDELADLMMAASKEVEESICRVAQMGRAAGMHLVIATQRPSADVITGLMKANIPSRIAFAVSSALESRIILDQGGADKLIGMGDMLYAPIGCGKPLRVQGAFVSDEEREKVIKYITKNSTAVADSNEELEQFMDKALEDKKATDTSTKGSENNSGLSGEYDEVLPQAVEVVLEMKQCSVSMLQRRLKLGYSRAARVVDQMEELGIVGPYEGAKPRSIVVDRNGWNHIQVKLGLLTEDDYSLAAEINESFDVNEEDYVIADSDGELNMEALQERSYESFESNF